MDSCVHRKNTDTLFNSSNFKSGRIRVVFAIYGPMICTAPFAMLFMQGDPLRGQVGGGGGVGLALQNKAFLGPVKKQRAVSQMPCGALKSRDFQSKTLSHLTKQWICSHQKHSVII